MNLNIILSNKLLLLSSGVAVLAPYLSWKYFITMYKSLKQQYDEEVLFRKRHDCVVMYTGPKGMSGWPPNTERIVPDLSSKNCLDVLYEPIIYFILTSRKTLDIACMMIGINKIFEAIILASKNGVRVRLLLNYEHSNNIISNIRECMKQGIEVQLYISHSLNLTSIMHNKFIVKDYSENGGYVVTGSMNLNQSAVTNNYEDIVFSSDHYVAKSFHDNFEKCFNYVKLENQCLFNKTVLMDINLM